MSGLRTKALLVAVLLTTTQPLHSRAAQPLGLSVGDGITIGGSVTNSMITNTVNKQDPAVLGAMAKTFADQLAATADEKAKAESRAAELAAKLGFTSVAVAEFFKIVGEQNVPDEKVPAKLIEIATHFTQTLNALAGLELDDPHAAELGRQAKQALDAGQLGAADSLLNHAMEVELARYRQAHEFKMKAQEAEDRHALHAASLLSGRGVIAMTRLDYWDAAELFRQAAALVPSGHVDEMAEYHSGEAAAFYLQGIALGDNAALAESIAIWHLAVREYHRDREPHEWALAHAFLGLALLALGSLENGTTHLEEAVAAHGVALEELSRDRVPLEWAAVQAFLGVTLSTLGEREIGTTRLHQAVSALRAAQEEYTRDREPLAWATVQAYLATALATLGWHESGTARLVEAVAAFRVALEERTRARGPLQWAGTQHYLGLALWALGTRESGTARLEEAVAAFRAALEERTRARGTLNWAYSRHGLALALATLAMRQTRTATMEEALTCMRDAIEGYQQIHENYWLPQAQRGIAQMETELAELQR